MFVWKRVYNSVNELDMKMENFDLYDQTRVQINLILWVDNFLYKRKNNQKNLILLFFNNRVQNENSDTFILNLTWLYKQLIS